MRQAFERLQVLLLCESGFNAANNPYSSKGFFKLCDDYGVPHNLMRCWNEKFFWTQQHGDWSDYIGPDLMMHWISKKSLGLTYMGLYKISEIVRVYVYQILSLKASVRSLIVGNMASELTAQKVFLNNFKNVVNGRIDISEDIKHYQDTLSYALS